MNRGMIAHGPGDTGKTGETIGQRLSAALGRITLSGGVIPELDGLRAVAIAWVLLFHINIYLKAKLGEAVGLFRWQPEVDYVAGLGFRGVSLFFALSGFILALPFIRSYRGQGREPTPGEFWKRRLLRLGPPYVINLTLLLLVLAATHQMSPGLLRNYIASTFCVSYLVDGRPSMVNGVAWSLEVEFQFYLVAPFLIRLCRPDSATIRRAGLVSLMVLGVVLRGSGWFTDKTLLGNLHSFGAGILLADLAVCRAWHCRPGRGWQDGVAVLGLASLLIPAGTSMWVEGVQTLGILALVGGTLEQGLVGRWLSRLGPVLVGGMCYTIYLYHYPVISLAGRVVVPWVRNLAPGWAEAVGAVVLAGAVLGVSVVLFLSTERPFMRKGWWRRPVPPTVQFKN